MKVERLKGAVDLMRRRAGCYESARPRTLRAVQVLMKSILGRRDNDQLTISTAAVLKKCATALRRYGVAAPPLL